MPRLTTAEFLKRIEPLAPMLTVAEDFEYVTMKTPAKFYCHDHGEFEALPAVVVRGNSTRCPGCPECLKEMRSENGALLAYAAHQQAELRRDKKKRERTLRRQALRRSGWKMHPWNPKTGEVYVVDRSAETDSNGTEFSA
jgi:hypothetical protein